MKIQQLIEEQMDALYDRTGINKKRRREVESIVRKLIEAVGEEITEKTYIRNENPEIYRDRMRLILKEILLNIK